jgi:hypothetical protein
MMGRCRPRNLLDIRKTSQKSPSRHCSCGNLKAGGGRDPDQELRQVVGRTM